MRRPTSSFARRASIAAALVAALSLTAGDAFARAGSGKSSGSRGSLSNSAPPVTNTAPRQAQPIPGAQQPAQGLRQAGNAAQAAQPSMMRNLMGGLAMGFLGAGLFGLLSGSGLFSGLGSFMGILGFLVQLALIFFVVRFALNFFRNRQAATAAAGAGHARQAMQPEWAPGANAQGGAAAAPAPIQLAEADFNAFERLLGEIQDAYSRDDRHALILRATPQMTGNFARDLDEMSRKGLSNKLSDVKLLQGDLSEAWREPGAEYATVAMRYAITDLTVEKSSGRVVSGDPHRPEEVTELWTFVRRPGESSEAWKLSAIQQA